MAVLFPSFHPVPLEDISEISGNLGPLCLNKTLSAWSLKACSHAHRVGTLQPWSSSKVLSRPASEGGQQSSPVPFKRPLAPNGFVLPRALQILWSKANSQVRLLPGIPQTATNPVHFRSKKAFSLSQGS